MELSSVLVLSLVTLVSATPHGYGVKGGASAKAEASAVAGAFGDVGQIPLSIPSGAAYSGSFSKSSSSSFASSSASSSSSSYSYSGSGNGITGFGTNGSGHKECSSGTCPGTAPSGPSVNGQQQFGGANAVATAQAKALSGSYTPCQGSTCSESPIEKCSTGQCLSNSEGKDQDNCGTGNCQSKSEPQSPSSNTGKTVPCSTGQCDADNEGDNSDSNDFSVNVNRGSKSKSKSSHDLSDQYHREKSSDTDCSNGKCIPANSYSGNAGNTQHQQSVPATYLTTPNENEPCTTPGCNYPSQSNSPQNSGLPSSYNVPIQSATNAPNTHYSPPSNSFPQDNQANPRKDNQYKPDVPCTSPVCTSGSNSAGTSNIPNNHFAPKDHSNLGPCASGQCDSSPNTHYSPSINSFPQDNHGNPSKDIQYKPGVPCTSPACSSAPQNTGTSNIPNNHFAPQDYSNLGPCASGRCGSSPNVGHSGNGALSGINPPNFSHGSYPSNVPRNDLDQPICNSPNCAGFSSYQPNLGSTTEPKYTIPAYSSSPENQQNKNCGGKACPGTEQIGLPIKPSDSNAPVYSGGFGGPTGIQDITSGVNKFPGQSGNHYNTANYQPSHGKPTEAFGPTSINGSPGTTKPSNFSPDNHYDSAHTHSSSGQNGPYESSHVQKPYSTSKTNEINSNQYGPDHTPSNGATTGKFSPHGNPSYTSSFGAPTVLNVPGGSGTQYDNSGIRKPSTVHSSNSPSFTSTIDGSITSSHSNSGSNSIHGSFEAPKPGSESNIQSSPIYTNALNGPVGPKGGSSSTFGITDKPSSGYCGVTGCNRPVEDKTKPTATTATQNKPIYTGGFGGPTGFLKPNDFNVPSHNSATLSEPSCTTGNCASKSPTQNHSHGQSLTGTQSVAGATASANAVAYSGSFGGPPGILKPYDDGKVNIPAHSNLGGIDSSPSHDTAHPGGPTPSGKHSIPDGSIDGSSARAQASASATATAGSYNDNNSYKNNGASGGCNSGCPNNGSNNDAANFGLPTEPLKNGATASAKSIAGANSFGYGSSIASSSASAHATAGAATKGGYGRK